MLRQRNKRPLLEATNTIFIASRIMITAIITDTLSKAGGNGIFIITALAQYAITLKMTRPTGTPISQLIKNSGPEDIIVPFSIYPDRY